MKNVLTFVLLFGCLNATIAQTSKGQWVIGGSTSFSTEKIKGSGGGMSASEDGPTKLNFAPQVGTFLMDNLAVGLVIDIQSESSKESSGSSTTTSTESTSLFGPFVRYYMGSGNVRFFGEGAFGFGSSKFKEGTSTESYSLSGYRLSAGPAIFFGDNASLEATLGYRSVGNTQKEQGQTYRISYNSFGLNVGFRIYL